MDGFDSEFQFGELEKQIKSTGRADLSVADGADSVYGNTTRAESREPRAESREPRAESREPRAESREPRAESREPRAESREPRAESREPRAESREPRAESRELWHRPSSCSPGRSMPRLSRCGPRRPPEPSPAARAGRGDSLRSRFLRRLRAALLLALAQSFALPLALPASAQEVVEVPRGWPLKPSGLSATQTEFRLLFVTSTTRNAASSNIADYNRFVQGRAAAGHSSIRSFSSKFRVVGSTGAVDARDNTSTTYTSADKGPPIWWLNGAKAADHYEDFYDGSWDNENARNERAMPRGPVTALGARAPDVVDRDQQQWHRRLWSRAWRVRLVPGRRALPVPAAIRWAAKFWPQCEAFSPKPSTPSPRSSS